MKDEEEKKILDSCPVSEIIDYLINRVDNYEMKGTETYRKLREAKFWWEEEV